MMRRGVYTAFASIVLLSMGASFVFFSGEDYLPENTNDTQSDIHPHDVSEVDDLSSHNALVDHENASSQVKNTANIFPQASYKTKAHDLGVFPAVSVPEVDTDASDSEATRRMLQVLTNSLDDLILDDGMSSHNLMILQDLSNRLAELQGEPGGGQKGLAKDEWPAEFLDMLNRLLLANQAESNLREAWQDKIALNPQAYSMALMEKRKKALGPRLYQALYQEDEMQYSSDGLSASLIGQEPIEATEAKKRSEQLSLLDQWQRDEISYEILSEQLSQTMTISEIEQLTETSSHHQVWLDKIGAFLEEYQYIEQSGIQGEDELQMRQELIERHFEPENRLVVNAFLFGNNSLN